MKAGGLTPWLAAMGVAAAVALVVTVLPRAGERSRQGDTPPRDGALVPIAGAASSGAEEAESATLVGVDQIDAPAPSAPAPPKEAALSGRGAPSPLRRSPGYYPPADPESASVRLGRREAPEVPDLFQGGAISMEEFGRLVVAALNALDEHEIHSLRVTRGEFEKIIWREFPQSRPITNITAGDAWSLSDPRSFTAVNRAIGIHGGRRLRFLTIEAASVQPFTNFLLHREVVINSVDEATAEIHKITIAPSIVERKGRFKALLYHD